MALFVSNRPVRGGRLTNLSDLTQQSLVLSQADAWWKVTVGTLPCIVRDPSEQRYHLKTCFQSRKGKSGISLLFTFHWQKKVTGLSPPTRESGEVEPNHMAGRGGTEYPWTVPVTTEYENPKWWLSGHWRAGSFLTPGGKLRLMGHLLFCIYLSSGATYFHY